MAIQGVASNASGTSWCYDVFFRTPEYHLQLWDNADDQQDVLFLLATDIRTRDYIFDRASKLWLRHNVPVQEIVRFFKRFGVRAGAPRLDDAGYITSFPFRRLRSINFWPEAMNFSYNVVDLYKGWAFLNAIRDHIPHLGDNAKNRLMTLLSQLPLLEVLKIPLGRSRSDVFEGMQPMPQLRELALDQCMISASFVNAFPQLETLFLGVMLGVTADASATPHSPGVAFPDSLTELRNLQYTFGGRNFVPVASTRFQNILGLLRNNLNLITLTLGELHALPTDNTSQNINNLDMTETMDDPVVQDDFRDIEAFAALPCWYTVTHMSMPLFPWHRMPLYAEYRRTRHNDTSLSFIPRSLRRLISPLRIDDRTLYTDNNDAPVALYYCPKEYLLPSECTIRNVMIISNITYGTRWASALYYNIQPLVLLLESTIMHIQAIKPVSIMSQKQLRQWVLLKDMLVENASLFKEMLANLSHIILSTTDLNVLKEQVDAWRQHLDALVPIFAQITDAWQQLRVSSTLSYEDDVTQFIDVILWMISILSNYALLPQNILGDAADIDLILDAISQQQTNVPPTKTAILIFLQDLYNTVMNMIDRSTSVTLRNHAMWRSRLVQNFEFAKAHGTTARSSFGASFLIPPSESVEAWLRLKIDS